jgi:FKBP-type peptidyl-prolyl cis-trans isomerase
MAVRRRDVSFSRFKSSYADCFTKKKKKKKKKKKREKEEEEKKKKKKKKKKREKEEEKKKKKKKKRKKRDLPSIYRCLLTSRYEVTCQQNYVCSNTTVRLLYITDTV